MRIIKAAGILAGRILSAAAGIGAALIVFSSFMVLEVEGNFMMPVLIPGQKILIDLYDRNNTDGRDDLNTGDIVICPAPYYDADGQGKYMIFHVTGMRGKWIEVKNEAAPAVIIEKEDVLGKVVKTWERKNAN